MTPKEVMALVNLCADSSTVQNIALLAMRQAEILAKLNGTTVDSELESYKNASKELRRTATIEALEKIKKMYPDMKEQADDGIKLARSDDFL